MAKFRDKNNGNVFEFLLEHDINTMRAHPEYEEVVEEILGYTQAEEPLVEVKPKKTKAK